ncbi:MAG: CHAT domain-containing protein, partial [Candidatus Acidiferrales bacterium]
LSRALAIDEKALGPNHPTVGAIVNMLAGLDEAQGRFREAEPLYKRALTIVVHALGPDHPRVAASLNNLAACFKNEGRFAEAEPLYQRAIAIDEKALGPDHPDLAKNLVNLALLYEAQGKNAEAGPLFERSLDITHNRFQYGFQYMSEKDRLQFLTTVQNLFPAYFSYAMGQRGSDPSVAGRMYDVLLWEKGLVGTSVAALRAQVANSGDPQTVKLLDLLTAKKNEASRLATSRPPGWEAAQPKLNSEANELEQQLARSVSSFGTQNTLARARWQDVQKALQPEDAAVEFTRFQFHDGKKFTNTFYYVALVVTRRMTLPGFVMLGEAQKLETTPVADYRSSVGRTRGVRLAKEQAGESGSAGASTAAFDAFWKPLEPALASVKRVYVAPDGVLNQLPLGLFADDSGQLLLEKYDLRPVNSTKDLLRPLRTAGSKTALLLGNPKFAMSEQEQKIAVEKLMSGEPGRPGGATPAPVAMGSQARGASVGPLPPLPSTQVEVEMVGKRMKEAGWQVNTYTGEMALQEVLDRMHSPRVVHVATHGFFLSDPDLTQQNNQSGDRPPSLQDPMLRSGLFFAGADRAESGAAPAAGLDDGVLTAYQAAQLDLQRTELVVLSACETGLGEQKNGEGVFGLRRGLQEAGAEAVLMSMWSVPDRETQELMALFYQKWLAGLDKHEALRQAQLKERETVRQRYGKDLLFYWGAFVLVGR